MNLNQLMNMVTRIVLRKAINKGINAGIDKATRSRPAPGRGEPHRPEQPPQGNGMTREQVRAERRARRAARQARQSKKR